MPAKTRVTWSIAAAVALAAVTWPSPAVAQSTYSEAYPESAGLTASVRILATPTRADVYVDGFFAGFVDDFNGVLHGLPMTPGRHAITLYMEGYRTITQNIVVAAHSAAKLPLSMEKLGPDEISALPPPPTP